jgi:hypothetical protein
MKKYVLKEWHNLLKAIDELRQDVKELRADMNKGKGVVSFLVYSGWIGITAIFRFL